MKRINVVTVSDIIDRFCIDSEGQFRYRRDIESGFGAIIKKHGYIAGGIKSTGHYGLYMTLEGKGVGVSGAMAALAIHYGIIMPLTIGVTHLNGNLSDFRKENIAIISARDIRIKCLPSKSGTAYAHKINTPYGEYFYCQIQWRKRFIKAPFKTIEEAKARSEKIRRALLKNEILRLARRNNVSIGVGLLDAIYSEAHT